MKFLVRNYSCLQNPWLGGYRPQIPVLSVLFPQLNLLNPSPPQKKTKFLSTPLNVNQYFVHLLVKHNRNSTKCTVHTVSRLVWASCHRTIPQLHNHYYFFQLVLTRWQLRELWDGNDANTRKFTHVKSCMAKHTGQNMQRQECDHVRPSVGPTQWYYVSRMES
jgi:hypothetical protein